MGEPWHKPKLKVTKTSAGQQVGQQTGSSKIRARPAEQKTLAEDDLKPEFKLKVAEWEVSNYVRADIKRIRYRKQLDCICIPCMDHWHYFLSMIQKYCCAGKEGSGRAQQQNHGRDLQTDAG